jgi:predicted SprT family Zn-dependent metalloprotease
VKYTQEFYEGLQKAYDRFYKELFDGELPQCLITLQRKTNILGFYRKSAFTNSKNENIAEIALNPDYFLGRTINEILSTLVHEQAHLFCDVRGYVSRKGWHSRQWCEVMKEQCGLQPVSCKDGKDCDAGGAKMTHRIVEGDLFDTVCQQLLTEVTFDLTNILEIKKEKEKKTTKFIYICSECNEEVTAKKEGLKLICGDCSCEMKMEIQ